MSPSSDSDCDISISPSMMTSTDNHDGIIEPELLLHNIDVDEDYSLISYTIAYDIDTGGDTNDDDKSQCTNVDTSANIRAELAIRPSSPNTNLVDGISNSKTSSSDDHNTNNDVKKLKILLQLYGWLVSIMTMITVIALMVMVYTIHDSYDFKMKLQFHNVITTSSMIRHHEIYTQHLQEQIQELQNEIMDVTNTYNQEKQDLQHQVHEMEAMISLSRDQEVSIEALQGTVQELRDYTSILELKFDKDSRVLNRQLRDAQSKSTQFEQKFNDVKHLYIDALDSFHSCDHKKNKLHKVNRNMTKEIKYLKGELRKTAKELSKSIDKEKRHKKTIKQLEERLADTEKIIEDNKKKTHKIDSTKGNTFPWETGKNSKYIMDDPSILIDNCWLYVKAKMDVGECVSDVTDSVKHHVQTLGKSFQSAVRNFRNEFDQFHKSEKKLYKAHKKLWSEFEDFMKY